MRPNLVQWQRDVYPEVHSLRSTLLVHVVTVPIFVAGTFALVFALLTLRPIAALAALGTMAVAFGAEAFMHEREPKSYAVEGTADLLSRVFVEHFVTFPRFVLDGGWAKAYREAPESSSRR
jgi:hypothetical protein